MALSEEKRAYMRQYHRDNFESYRNRQLTTKFGLSLDEYNAILEDQGGVCAICGDAETKMWKGRLCNLAVDHDHKTGRVRGLLCSNCNRGIGLLQDDIERLQAAINYLKEDNSVTED
jgi:hypothetical protein